MQTYRAEINKEVTALIQKYSKDHPTNKIEIRNNPLYTRFYTGYYVLGFDCQSLACISNIDIYFEDLRDWKGPMLKGFGATPIARIGTWVFDLQENCGRKQTIKVPGSLFVPNIRKCLASPQHISQKCEQTSTKKTVFLTDAQGDNFTFGLKGEHNL